MKMKQNNLFGFNAVGRDTWSSLLPIWSSQCCWEREPTPLQH